MKVYSNEIYLLKLLSYGFFLNYRPLRICCTIKKLLFWFFFIWRRISFCKNWGYSF